MAFDFETFGNTNNTQKKNSNNFDYSNFGNANKINANSNDQSIAQSVSSDFQKRTSTVQEAKTRMQQGKITSAEMGVINIGQSAGFLGDVAFDVVKGVTPDFVKNFLTKQASNDPIFKNLLSTASKGVDAYEKLKNSSETTKRAGDILESLVNIASITPLPVGAGKATNIATDIIDTTKTAKIAKTSEKVGSAINDLENTYKDIARGWVSTNKASQKAEKVTTIKNLSGTIGRTPERTLAESGIIPSVEGSKFSTITQSDKLLEDIKPLKEANTQALREAGFSTSPVSINNLEQYAVRLANSDKNIASGEANKLVSIIRKEMDAYNTHYNGAVNLETLDNIKSSRWNNAFWGITKEDKLSSDADYLIGKAAQNIIEETAAKAGNQNVAQLNRDIGDFIEAARFLRSLDGKKVLYGKMGEHLTRITGAIVGSNFGIPGSIAGIYISGIIGDMLRSNYISGPTKRAILRQIEKENPKAYIETMKWLEEQGIARELRLRLPSPEPLGTAKNPIITKPPTTYEKSAPYIKGNLPSTK